MVEIRELLRSVAQSRGATVFMSSHILPEVDRLATRIGIIHQGRLIEELDAKSIERLRLFRLRIQTRNIDAALQALRAAGFAPEVDGEMLILVEDRAVQAPDEVAQLLVRAGTSPTHLAVTQEDLESHFLRLIEATL